ncbi:MAG: hypothetical protein ACRCTZ_05930 [Sarcina sp.]
MVNKRLLDEIIDDYNSEGVKLKSIKYNKDLFKDIFNEYTEYGMAEKFYCCHGLEHSCWTEVVEKGNWGLTMDDVKVNILSNIKRCRKYLYNGRRYGKDRLYICEIDNELFVYIYLRDLIGVDYHIGFSK